MKNYLSLWTENLLERRSLSLPTGIDVKGERNKHVGPRYEFARVEFRVEPASLFEVVDNGTITPELSKLGYPDWAIFGLLDILLLAEPSPLHQVRVTLKSAGSHPVDSSPIAFRHAGRDAGQKILEFLKRPM